MSEASLLFVDECSSHQTRISSITGCRIPLQKVDDFRLEFYSKIIKRLAMNEDHLHTHLPALHGSSMLNDYENATDDMKIGAFSDVAELVVNADLRLYRYGQYVSSTIRDIAGSSETGEGFAYGFSWMMMLSLLKPYLEDNYIIPIMDGFNEDQVRRFSQMPISLGMIRAQGNEDILTIKNSNHLLGEVYYADHRYSILTQVVDVCGYLRHVLDRERAGIINSEFLEQLLPIARKLNSIIVHEEVAVMRYNEQLTGPDNVSFIYKNVE